MKKDTEELENLAGDEMLDELSNLDYEDDSLQLLDDDAMDFSNLDDGDDNDTFGSFYDDENEFVSDNSNESFAFEEEFDLDPFEGLEISDYSEDTNDDNLEISSTNREEKNTNIDDYLSGILEAKRDLEKAHEEINAELSLDNDAEQVNLESASTEDEVSSSPEKVAEEPFVSYQTIAGNDEIASLEPNDISLLFDRVSTNVKEASSIFNRNLEMKKKIDERFEELKKLQSEHERNKKIDYDEINAYKDEVYLKLKEKKAEVESKLNELKDLQAKFDQEKAEFEKYKSETLTKLKDAEREQTLAYNERKEEITKLEDKLIKKKDSIDEEKRQLKLDRIQYETEKNALATNLVKFNELVGDFTVGIDKFNSNN